MYSQVFFICAVYNDHLKNKYSDLFFRKKIKYSEIHSSL